MIKKKENKKRMKYGYESSRVRSRNNGVDGKKFYAL
jgi:hypothetical protein